MAAPVKKRRKKKAKQSSASEPPKPPPIIQADFTMHPGPLNSQTLNVDSPADVGTEWLVVGHISGNRNVYRVTARGRRRRVERIQYVNVEDLVTHEVNLDFFDKWKGVRFTDFRLTWMKAATRDRVFRQGWARATVINGFGKRWAKALKKGKTHGKNSQGPQRKVRGTKGKAKAKAGKIRHQRRKANSRK